MVAFINSPSALRLSSVVFESVWATSSLIDAGPVKKMDIFFPPQPPICDVISRFMILPLVINQQHDISLLYHVMVL